MSALQDVFSNFGYTISPGQADVASVTSTFPMDWVERYFREGFDRLDPIFLFASQHRRRCGYKLLSPSDMQSPLFEEARMHSADSNVMITDFFGGSTMVLGGVNHEMADHQVEEAMAVCKLTHRRAIASRIHKLTDKQIDLLEMIEMGYRDNEICHELNVSSSAISQRKSAICSTLGLQNFQSAAQLYSAHKWSGIIAG